MLELGLVAAPPPLPAEDETSTGGGGPWEEEVGDNDDLPPPPGPALVVDFCIIAVGEGCFGGFGFLAILGVALFTF